jgi:hypothetical protein
MTDAPPNPPPHRGRHRLPLSGLSGPSHRSSWKLVAFSLLGAVLVAAVLFGLASTSAEHEMAQQGHFDDEIEIAPGKEFGYLLVVALSSSYHLRVKALDGQARIAVGRVDDGDRKLMDARDVAGVMENAVVVEAGQSKSLKGVMERGRYRWVVANPSATKPLRVIVKFD